MKRIKAMTINGKSLKDCKLGRGWLMRSESGEYEVLEWIRGGAGGQWIDTGIPIGPYFKWRTKVTIVENNVYSYIGRFDISPSLRFFFVGGNVYFDYGGTGSRITVRSFFTIGQTIEVGFSRINGVNCVEEVSVGTVLGNLICPDVYFGDYTFTVFNAPQKTTELVDIKSHYIDYINPDGSVGLSLVPARRLSDGEVGMYDRVSQTFFTNQGTGAFIPGPATGRFL